MKLAALLCQKQTKMGKEIMPMEGKSISQLIGMELESESAPSCQKQTKMGKEITPKEGKSISQLIGMELESQSAINPHHCYGNYTQLSNSINSLD